MLRIFSRIRLLLSKKRLPDLYGLICCSILLISTLVWSQAIARMQQTNSDQLVDGYLFGDWRTLHNAIFPTAHTQLLKWPLFWLIGRLGFSSIAYDSLTVLVTVATIAAFAFLIYRIERRPLVFGSLYLLLASVLTLTPAQALDTAVTTPLSLAMLTGRNVEYIIFIATLIGFIRVKNWRTWQFGLSTLGLSLLLASDQLFWYCSIGGAILCLSVGWLWRQRPLITSATFWFTGSVLAWMISRLTLAGLNRYVIRIADYPLGMHTVHSRYQIWQGMVNLVHALGLNFGLTWRYGWLSAGAWMINCLVVCLIICACSWLSRCIAEQRKTQVSTNRRSLSTSQQLSIMLLSSTIVVAALFVVLNLRINDARYLTIALFSGITTLASWSAKHRWPRRGLTFVGCVAIAALSLGLLSSVHHTHKLARTNIQNRNVQVAAILQAHTVHYLTGNYWRVLPIKLLSPKSGQAIVPLEGCLTPLSTLTSSAWQPDLRRSSFAYLLSLRSTGTASAVCRTQTIIRQYGLPTATVIIAGPFQNPAEELLFYDRGAADRTHLLPTLEQRPCLPPLCLVR